MKGDERKKGEDMNQLEMMAVEELLRRSGLIIKMLNDYDRRLEEIEKIIRLDATFSRHRVGSERCSQDLK